MGDDHSVCRGAAVAARHVRGDGVRGHVAGQPVADGADRRHRFRRRRRDRDDREHRALHRAGQGRTRSRRDRRTRDRLHGAVADGVPGRGVPAAAADAGRHRAPVPRVRVGADDRGHDLDAGVADPDADDVRLSASTGSIAGGRRCARTPCRERQAHLVVTHRGCIRAQPRLGVRAPAPDHARRVGVGRGHDRALHRDPEGPAARTGHRSRHRRGPGRRQHRVPGDGGTHAHGRRDARQGSRGSRCRRIRRRGHDQSDPEPGSAQHRAQGPRRARRARPRAAAPAEGGRRDSGGRAVPQAGAGHHPRHAGCRDRVPVRAVRRERRGAVRLRRAHDRGAARSGPNLPMSTTISPTRATRCS